MLALLALLGAAFSAGRMRADGASESRTPFTAANREQARAILRAVYDSVATHFYDPGFHERNLPARYAEMDRMIQRATSMPQAMTVVAALLEPLDDPHVFFLPPGYKHPLVVYGFRFMMVGNDCYVTEIDPGSDAAKKLYLGERLLSVEGEPLTRENFWKVDYNLKVLSPRDLLHIGIEETDEPTGNAAGDKTGRNRGGDPDTGEGEVIVQARIRTQTDGPGAGGVHDQEAGPYSSRRAEFSKEGVLIWKIPRFPLESDDAVAKWKLTKAYKALVLDLRGTDGEWDRGDDSMLGNLLGKDTQVGSRITRKGSEPYIVKAEKIPFRGELVVLVDSGTSGSAEILARVMQIEKRGVVIGDRTAGAATESKVFSCATGEEPELEAAHVSISVAEIRMADGQTIGKEGVAPDDVVLPSQDDLKAGRDPQLARAAGLAGLAIDAKAAGKIFPPD